MLQGHQQPALREKCVDCEDSKEPDGRCRQVRSVAARRQRPEGHTEPDEHGNTRHDHREAAQQRILIEHVKLELPIEKSIDRQIDRLHRPGGPVGLRDVRHHGDELRTVAQ